MPKAIKNIIPILLIMIILFCVLTSCTGDIENEYDDAYDCWVFSKPTGELLKLDNQDMTIIERTKGFENVVSIAVDPDDSCVLVLDRTKKAVIFLDSHGSITKHIYGFEDPTKLVYNPSNKTFWVADKNRLIHLSQDGDIENIITGFGEIKDIDCAYNFGGRIWLASSDGYVALIDPDGDENCRFELEEPILVEAEKGSGLNWCWVASGKDGNIFCIDENGEQKYPMEGEGDRNYGENPIIFEYSPSDSTLWVGYDNGRIYRLDAVGLNSWGDDYISVGEIGGLAIDNSLRFAWVADSGSNKILQIDSSGAIIQTKKGIASPGACGVVNKIF
ncbi:MAG: hypothetical protein DRH49_07145 [Candidatus Coatesbacteria bacterium]|nr:MAG: hypothetical protein DRH49_07145 [Candidatus Coatesbacteria bacterium]